MPRIVDASDARITISPGANNKYSASTTSSRSTIPGGNEAKLLAFSRAVRRPNMAPS